MIKMINLRSATFMMFVAFLTMPLFAQPGGVPGQRRQMSEQNVKDRVARTADTLNMTDKQEKEILEFELKLFKKIQKERANFNPETGDRDAMRAKMMEIREERDAKYKEVLTKEQFGEYSRMVEERRSNMRQIREQEPDGDRSRGRGGS